MKMESIFKAFNSRANVSGMAEAYIWSAAASFGVLAGGLFWLQAWQVIIVPLNESRPEADAL